MDPIIDGSITSLPIRRSRVKLRQDACDDRPPFDAGNDPELPAAACAGLITFYVRFVLASRGHAAAFGCALAALHGLPHGILSSADYALLMGSLLAFGLLGAVMVLTRKVNWAWLSQSGAD